MDSVDIIVSTLLLRLGEKQKENIESLSKFLIACGYSIVGEKSELGTAIKKLDGSTLQVTGSEEGKPLAVYAKEYAGRETTVISSKDENSGAQQIMTKIVEDGLTTYYCAILGTGGRIKKLSITTSDSRSGKRETKIIEDPENYDFPSLLISKKPKVK